MPSYTFEPETPPGFHECALWFIAYLFKKCSVEAGREGGTEGGWWGEGRGGGEPGERRRGDRDIFFTAMVTKSTLSRSCEVVQKRKEETYSSSAHKQRNSIASYNDTVTRPQCD